MANDCSILIKNGLLVSQDYDMIEKDILIEKGFIKEISNNININKGNGCIVINANKHIVSPGFISIHSHDDFYFHLKNHPIIMKSLAYQGITTTVGGNCGISSYPFKRERAKDLESYQGFIHYDKPVYEWGKLSEYINLVKNKILFNFIPLVGHGTVRVIANGFKKKINKSSMDSMKKMIKECMETGAFGMTTGLMYMPGTFSETEEIIELGKIVAKYPNSIYATHMRGYSDTFIESIKESIEIGEKTGLKVQISHLGPFGIKFGPKIFEALEIINKAREQGIDIKFDSLAYCGGSTTIMAIIPPWAYARGITKFLSDIRNDEYFKKVINYMENYVPKWPSWEGTGWTDNFIRSLGWENIYVLSAKNPEFIGKNFIDIALERKIDKYEALRQVLIEENASAIMYMAGVGSCLDDNGDMSYFDAMIEDPNSLISVDALFSCSGKTMPYAYGTFPRIINRYVKNKKTISLKDAISKFTSKVSERFNLKDRGLLRVGQKADIVVFDIENIMDYPDIFAKQPKLSSGIEYLLVNGQILIENGNYKDVLAGEVILNK